MPVKTRYKRFDSNLGLNSNPKSKRSKTPTKPKSKNTKQQPTTKTKTKTAPGFWNVCLCCGSFPIILAILYVFVGPIARRQNCQGTLWRTHDSTILCCGSSRYCRYMDDEPGFALCLKKYEIKEPGAHYFLWSSSICSATAAAAAAALRLPKKYLIFIKKQSNQ